MQSIITDTGAINKGLGLECAGFVSEIGPSVNKVKVGDRIGALSCGAFTTSLVVSQVLCFKIPDEMSFEEAASIPVTYGTVVHGMIDQAKLSSGMVCN